MAPKVIFADSMDGAVRASIPPGSFMLAPPRAGDRLIVPALARRGASRYG
jgi:hypothetical protein